MSLTFPALADGFFFSTNTTWEAPETLRFTQIKLGEQAEVKITVFTMTGLVLLLLLSHFSRVRLLVTPWTVASQAPLSMRFPRQEYWSGLPFPPPGDLPDPGIELESPVSPALAGGFFTTEPPTQA